MTVPTPYVPDRPLLREARPATVPIGLQPNAVVLDLALAGSAEAISEACRRGSGPELVASLRQAPWMIRGSLTPPLGQRLLDAAWAAKDAAS